MGKSKIAKWLRISTLGLAFWGLPQGIYAQTDVIQDEAFENDTLMWINHLDFLPGASDVKTYFNATTSGGLVVRSTTLGSTSVGGGNKVVEMSLEIPPRNLLKGVRICYKTSNRRTYITQTRLAQLSNPPTAWLVRMDDPADLNSTTPICVNSIPISFNPQVGSVRYSLRLNYGSTADSITILATGLWLQPY